MPDSKPVSWSCPLCGLRTFPYGTTCPSFKDGTCENMDKLHITGTHYLTDQPQTAKVTSIGIAQISDEV